MRYFAIDRLESRLFFSNTPTKFDQYMLELINRRRADPDAQAALLGIDLNEGLAAGTISSAAKQPLAFNPDLLVSSSSYSKTLLTAYNYFDHFYNGTNPQTRMSAAGYVFSGSYTYGENLAVQASTATFPVTTAITETEYDDLFIDSGVAGRGHRLNLMDGSFKEVGVGEVAGSNYTGLDTPPDMTAYNAVLATQDFAASGSDPNPFITGVAYNDTVTADNFYTPGEGLGGITVTATRTSDNSVFSTTTWSSGGYSLPVPAGTYNVEFSGGTLPELTYDAVVVGSQNVEVDAVQGNIFTTRTNGVLNVAGTAQADNISVSESGGNVIVDRNGVSESLSSSGINSIIVSGGAGADSITINSDVAIPTVANGGKGGDTIVGGGGAGSSETLSGGKGHDSITGGSGHDSLVGGRGADTLMAGAAGDTLMGGQGANRLVGGIGNDLFLAINQAPDSIIGGGGSDTAHVDPLLDSVTGVTSVLDS